MAPDQVQPGLLGERLATARRRRFVGRGREIDLFRSVLLHRADTPAVLWIHGMGGVGKSTLLGECARIAREAGSPVTTVDARDADGFAHANPESIRDRFPSPASFAVSGQSGPGVLLIDAFEKMGAVADWLFAEYLPTLPGNLRIVIAGREPVPLRWRADPGWGSLIHQHRLENFERAEAETYLTVSGVSADQHESILAYTRGHPLALSLAADCQIADPGAGQFTLVDHPDVVGAILERLVQQIDDEARRDALVVLALARTVNEALLAAIVGQEGAPAVFQWLRSLSFVAADRHGLFAHDLAREVLETDAIWRDPSRRARVSHALILALEQRLMDTATQDQTQVWMDLIYACRGNRDFASVFDYSHVANLRIVTAPAELIPQFVEAIRRFRGPDSAALLEKWSRERPDAVLAFLDDNDRAVGFQMHIRLSAEELAAVDHDPVIRSIRDHVARGRPLQPHESIWISRFMADLEAYQAPSRSLNLTAVSCSIQWTTDPNLAWNFICVDDPAPFVPHFSTIHMWRFPELDVAMDGRSFGIFGHDWHAETVAEWLDNKARIASNTQQPVDPGTRGQNGRGPALSRDEFDGALRQALRDLHNPAALARNPLAMTRLGEPETADGSRAAALRQCLVEAMRAAGAVPRARMHLAAVDVTYVRPAGSQELAAEALDIPFNTYRYRLQRGIEILSDWLRERLNEPA
ncbi:MAG: hypothetical protein M3Y37_01995 [Chloroflexota bacterium]|nr:hypothetical protein [Chloroflexota bacterium]